MATSQTHNLYLKTIYKKRSLESEQQSKFTQNQQSKFTQNIFPLSGFNNHNIHSQAKQSHEAGYQLGSQTNSHYHVQMKEAEWAASGNSTKMPTISQIPVSDDANI